MWPKLIWGPKGSAPETSKKFYDLEKDPIVSPYTGKEYPLSFFEADTSIVAPAKPAEAEKPAEAVKAAVVTDDELDVDDDGPEIISLEDAEESVDDDDDEEVPDIPDIPDIDEDDDDAAEDNTFLETDDEDDDLSDVIVGRESGDDES